MLTYSFLDINEKKDIPNPKCDIVNLGCVLKLLPNVIYSALGFGRGTNVFQERREDLEAAEIVPITWE